MTPTRPLTPAIPPAAERHRRCQPQRRIPPTPTRRREDHRSSARRATTKNRSQGSPARTAVAALVVSRRADGHAQRTAHRQTKTTTSHPNTQISVLAAPTTTSAPAAGEPRLTHPLHGHRRGMPARIHRRPIGRRTRPHPSLGVRAPAATSANTCVLNLGRTMVITAVSLTPGWVGADASGADQWHQHRVLTRVQWSFNDSPPTVVPQDTDSVHGEAAKPMPDRGVLASRIIMLVQETGRAPADAAPTTSPTPGDRWTVRRRPGPARHRQPAPSHPHRDPAGPARRPKPHRPRRQHLRGVVDQDLRPPTPVRGLTTAC